MKTLCALVAAFLLTMCAVSHAATAVNLQTCAVTPTTGGLMGCTVTRFAPVAPETLVRSIVNGGQGWRAFSTLTPSDTVYASDGTWHALSALTVALQPTSTPPPTQVVPPPPSLTQDVLITLVGGTAPQSVVFSGVSVPACFAIGPPPAKQVCLP